MAAERDSTRGPGFDGVSPSGGASGVASPSGGHGPGALSRDEAFDLLSNRRRRWTLHALGGRVERPTELRKLSTQVAAWENAKSIEGITNTERRRVYTSLQQFHLPKLATKGVVTYDETQGTVALTPEAAELDVYLDVVAGNEIPWSLYYVGLSAMSIATLLGVWIGLPPLGALSALGCGFVIALGFGLSAIVHYSRDRRTRLGEPGPPKDSSES